MRLLTAGSLVRVQQGEPKKPWKYNYFQGFCHFAKKGQLNSQGCTRGYCDAKLLFLNNLTLPLYPYKEGEYLLHSNDEFTLTSDKQFYIVKKIVLLSHANFLYLSIIDVEVGIHN